MRPALNETQAAERSAEKNPLVSPEGLNRPLSYGQQRALEKEAEIDRQRQADRARVDAIRGSR